MPEQSAHHQENSDSDQQVFYYKKMKSEGDTYENNRYNCAGRIQCRN